MSESEHKAKHVLRTLIGDESGTNRFPIINHVIMVYLGLVMLCFTLYTIAPFVTFIGKTPFYSSKSYLGILGGLLLVVDLFTNRGLWRGPYVIALYTVAAISVVSSLLTISYGIKQNLFLLCWTAVQFALFYSCAWRVSRDAFRKYVKILYFTLLGVWLIACCVSLWQYLFQIGYTYVADPRSDDASLVRQGFYGSRLFGIFNPLNHSAYVSLMLLLGGVYYFAKAKRTWQRIALGISGLILFSHIMLSNSRSAAVSMLVCVFIGIWCLSWSRSRFSGWKKLALACALALAVAVCCVPVFNTVKAAAGKVPYLIESITAPDPTDPTDPTAETEPEPEEDLLEREELEGNVSNDRFRIWGEYLGLADDIGLLGLSPGNYMPYIRDHYPDLFIVQYVRDHFPAKYDAGVIYHVHNGYLMVLVSTGILGVLALAVYLVLCVARCLRHIARSAQLAPSFVVLLMIAASGAVSAFFDKGIFFMDSAPTFYFWFALGILMYVTKKENSNHMK